MAALTITAANVLKSATASIVNGTAGATITAGQLVYYDGSTTSYKLADSDIVAASVPAGIALHGSLSGQPLQVLTGGPITLGATLTPGVAYYANPTAGGIGPVADVVTTNRSVMIGFATSASILNVNIQDSGVVL